jgi:hypothetical protein
MTSFAAYHRTHEHGKFSHSYYITAKLKPDIGEVLYVISGDKPRKPNYFLEGRFIVKSVESTDEGKRRLILEVDALPSKPLLLNSQVWFDNTEFHNLFTAGANMNPVRPEYERRFEKILRKAQPPIMESPSDPINDIGSDFPGQVNISGLKYSRDPKIREAVKRRANGKCEFCGEAGFICTDGTPYLESHHIIALKDEGADRLTNVIALCPKHHREAHFGERRDELEKEMAKKVQAINGGGH